MSNNAQEAKIDRFFVDTREFLDYNAVSRIFKSVWCSEIELFWFEKAWSILHKHGLNRYTNDEEYYLIYIRAVTISMMYEEFCSVSCGESPEFDYAWKLVDVVPGLVLGQLFAHVFPDEISESENYVIEKLADHLRSEVVAALKKELTDIEIYHYLQLTVDLPIVIIEDEDEEKNGGEYEEDLIPNSYFEYVSVVESIAKRQIDTVTMSDCRVYEWIEAGMPYVGPKNW